MAPPTTKPPAPTLATLTEERFRSGVTSRLDRILDLFGEWSTQASPRSTSLGINAAALLTYARQGLDPDGYLCTHSKALHMTRTIARAYYTSCSDLAPIEQDPTQIEPRQLLDPVAIVLVAASARAAIARGKPVTVLQLATLSSVTPRAIWIAAKEGRLVPKGAVWVGGVAKGASHIEAQSAAAWLTAHGVEGVTCPKAPRKKA